MLGKNTCGNSCSHACSAVNHNVFAVFYFKSFGLELWQRDKNSFFDDSSGLPFRFVPAVKVSYIWDIFQVIKS